MEIVSVCPLRVGALAWTSSRGERTLTVVCKATLAVAPGEMRLAERQEEPSEEDNHWNDDEARSLYAASDLLPGKRGADVLLVGYAFAPRGTTTSRLVARLRIGTIDKSVEIVGDRIAPRGEAPAAPAEFVRMPLLYERAAFGPSNPVGVRSEGAGSPLPNLLRPGQETSPIGFGPIAPTWPERAAYLGGALGPLGARRLREEPLPEGVDPRYFNAAPKDQQLPVLREDETIALEGLSPEHARLVTRLPGLRPAVYVERAGGQPTRLRMVCDTLWIDSARGFATLTWRGHAQGLRPEEAGRILVGMERLDRRADFAELVGLAEGSGSIRRGPPSRPGPLSGHGSPERPAQEPRPARGVGMVRGPYGDSTATVQVPAEIRNRSLPFREASPGEPALPSLPPPPAPVVAAPPPPSSAPSLPVPLRPADPGVRSEPEPPSRGPRAWQPAPEPPAAAALAPAAAAALRGAGDASNAAADPAPAVARFRASPAQVPLAPARVELLFWQPNASARLRASPRWSVFLKERSREEAGRAAPPPSSKEARARRDIGRVLGLGAPEDADLRSLEASPDEVGSVGADGTLEAPVLLVSGDLVVSFDPALALGAALAVVAPFAAADKRLKDAADAARELLGGPGAEGASALAERHLAELREAFTPASRSLPSGFLDAAIERASLERRGYQKRTLLGDECLRAALVEEGESSPGVPAYPPASIASRLPMFARLPVRAVVEVHPRQDQYEPHPLALRVLALARVVNPPRS